MLKVFGKILRQHSLAQPLGIWGKLASHHSYVVHRISPQQAAEWQRWVSRVWLRPHADAMPVRQRQTASVKQAWIELKPRAVCPDPQSVPVAFILPPGTMSFAPRQYVQGVMVASQDSVGRRCPMIISQVVSRRWIMKTWKASSGTAGEANQTGMHLLYGLSRLAARMHAAELSPAQISAAVDEIWAWFESSASCRQAPHPPEASKIAIQDILRRHGVAHEALDTAMGFHGVSSLPWTNWPQRLWHHPHGMAAFWQHDLSGGYINASDCLATLWRSAP